MYLRAPCHSVIPVVLVSNFVLMWPVVVLHFKSSYPVLWNYVVVTRARKPRVGSGLRLVIERCFRDVAEKAEELGVFTSAQDLSVNLSHHRLLDLFSRAMRTDSLA